MLKISNSLIKNFIVEQRMERGLILTIKVALLLFITSCTTYQTIVPRQEDSYDKLLKLSELLEKQVLTESEFIIEKQKLLNPVSSFNGVDNISKNSNNAGTETDLLVGELTACDKINFDYNALPQSYFDDFCVGHSTSFDYYTKLSLNDCGDFEKLIEISKMGYETECENGIKEKNVF